MLYRPERLGLLVFVFFAVFGLNSVTLNAMADEAYVGVVYPEQDLLLSFGVSGLVTGDPVKPGSSVIKGQTLIQLETTLQRIELERRRLSWQDDTEQQLIRQRLDILQQQLESAERLYNQSRSVSLDELNKLRMEVLALEGRLAQIAIEKLKAGLEYQLVEEEIRSHQIHAPIDGTIIQVKPSAGEWAKQGEAIIRLVDTKTAHIKINIPDHQARSLNKGQEAQVRIEGFEAPIAGLVDFILPIADAASGLVEVKINIANPDGDIRPGSKASVSFLKTTETETYNNSKN